MKYLKFSPIVFAFAFLLYYYFGVYQPQERASFPQNQPSEQSTNTGQKQWETKTDDQPPVTIEITPIELAKSAENWKFKLTFDTHSGSLDDNPLTVVSLEDNKGNTYQPTTWEGPGPGGHHREGVLTFSPILPLPEYVELKIKNVGGITERSFRWNVK